MDPLVIILLSNKSCHQLCAQESKDRKVTASTLNKFNNDVFKSFSFWLEDGKTSHFLRACKTKEDAE